MKLLVLVFALFLLLSGAAWSQPASQDPAYDARLVAIESAGHLPQVETFDQYWSALEEFRASKAR